MNCLTEALGMGLKGNGTIPAVYSARIQLAKHAGMQIMELVRKDIKPRDIMTKDAFLNALTVDMALGCSTNSMLHLPAIAHEAGVELNMEIAEFMLQNEGADVEKAWNGQEAVEVFKKSEPGEFDVILMDIMMPVMNGYEATKRIRSLDREDAKTIPIIAMTANAFTEDRIRAKEAGMNEHVAKPVDVELLVKVIHKLVG